MKAILMSINTWWVAKILNGEKTIEIRKKFPKDYVGWVYIYCTKDSNNLLHKNIANIWWVEDKDFQKKNKLLGIKQEPVFNGKVVARFWCDKVEDYVNGCKWSWKKGVPIWGIDAGHEKILKTSCLTEDELYDYCEDLSFKAIHINKLEIFDEPKELNEFYGYTNKKVERYTGLPKVRVLTSLKKAPQSWQYIEVEE